MENKADGPLGQLQWLTGLEDYLEFSNDSESKKFINFMTRLVYAEPACVSVNKDIDVVRFVQIVKSFIGSPAIDTINKYLNAGGSVDILCDAYSRGQVKSKIWLAKELSNIKKDFDTVYLLAGWYGQLVKYLDCAEISYNKVRTFDIDAAACTMSDRVFNIDKLNDYTVKSVELDLTDTNWIYSTGCQYNIKNYTNDKVFSEKTVPDLIINTSAEHFDSAWYKKFVEKKLPTNPLFVIQTNNFFDVDEHINCVADLEEMKHKFPMSDVLYQGQLDLIGYKRFMLIGRP